MRGKIFCYGPPCPICGGKFQPIPHPTKGYILDFECPEHRTTPKTYGIDARPFKNAKGCVGRIYRGDKDELIHSSHEALMKLGEIQVEWSKDPEKFDPAKFSASGRRSRKLRECVDEYEMILKQASPPKSRYYLDNYRTSFGRHILPFMGETSIKEITPGDIVRLQGHLKEKGLQPESVKTHLQKLRTLLRYYYEYEMVLDRVPPFPKGKRESVEKERYTTTPEVQREIWMKMPEDTHLLMELYCHFAGRPSEAVAFKGMDLLPDGRIFVQRSLSQHGTIGPPKNGHSRKVEIPADLYARLKALGRLHDAFLFTRNGKPITPDRLSQHFRKAADECGYPQLELYPSVKHSMASITAREAERDSIHAAAQRVGVTDEVARQHYIQKGEVVRMREG